MKRTRELWAKLPRSYRPWGACVLALLLTAGLLAGYETAFRLPPTSHPYVVGLFSVILCALLLGHWPGVVSYAVSCAYFSYLLLLTSDWQQVVLTTLFFVEGAVVLIMAYLRQQSADRLAKALDKRERELAELGRAHDRLQSNGTLDRVTNEQLRSSNRIMLETLERILDRNRGRG